MEQQYGNVFTYCSISWAQNCTLTNIPKGTLYTLTNITNAKVPMPKLKRRGPCAYQYHVKACPLNPKPSDPESYTPKPGGTLYHTRRTTHPFIVV